MSSIVMVLLAEFRNLLDRIKKLWKYGSIWYHLLKLEKSVSTAELFTLWMTVKSCF